MAPFQRGRPLRLLVVPHGECRLAATGPLLCTLGYDAASTVGIEDARAQLDAKGAPDVLLTVDSLDGRVFARECLARHARLRALYVCWMPTQVRPALVPREQLLPAPFTAAGLATALAPCVNNV